MEDKNNPFYVSPSSHQKRHIRTVKRRASLLFRIFTMLFQNGFFSFSINFLIIRATCSKFTVRCHDGNTEIIRIFSGAVTEISKRSLLFLPSSSRHFSGEYYSCFQTACKPSILVVYILHRVCVWNTRRNSLMWSELSRTAECETQNIRRCN